MNPNLFYRSFLGSCLGAGLFEIINLELRNLSPLRRESLDWVPRSRYPNPLACFPKESRGHFLNSFTSWRGWTYPTSLTDRFSRPWKIQEASLWRRKLFFKPQYQLSSFNILINILIWMFALFSLTLSCHERLKMMYKYRLNLIFRHFNTRF